MLYELLFGSLNEVKVDAKGVEMELPVETPSWLKDFLNKMLALNPEDRHTMEDIEMISRSALQCSDSTDIHHSRV